MILLMEMFYCHYKNIPRSDCIDGSVALLSIRMFLKDRGMFLVDRGSVTLSTSTCFDNNSLSMLL